MSGIARLFARGGFEVTGSDSRESANTVSLRDEGIPVSIGHQAAHVAEATTVVVTGAIAEDNPEYCAARASGTAIVHRAQALAWLIESSRVVAVAGAHGKTTSTGMLVSALVELGEDPSFVNGGVIRGLDASSARGSSDIFVVEADESDGSFLLYNAAIALITNVDPDHLDHYGSAENFVQAFVSFAAHASELVAISSDDEGAVRVTAGLDRERVVTFGWAADADVRIHSVSLAETVSFALAYLGENYEVHLAVTGRHNAINAAGAFAVLTGLGFEARASARALGAFRGAERRFEFRGESHGVRVFDDFAHHPTEIAAALEGARAAAGTGRVIPIFQPHLFSRTATMTELFAHTLERLADHTIIVPIYPARETPIPGVTGQLIADHFVRTGTGVYVHTWEEAIAYAVALVRPGDVLVPMGGGDIHLIVPDLLRALDERDR